jgi:hypothetical protein
MKIPTNWSSQLSHEYLLWAPRASGTIVNWHSSSWNVKRRSHPKVGGAEQSSANFANCVASLIWQWWWSWVTVWTANGFTSHMITYQLWDRQNPWIDDVNDELIMSRRSPIRGQEPTMTSSFWRQTASPDSLVLYRPRGRKSGFMLRHCKSLENSQFMPSHLLSWHVQSLR